MKFIRYGVALVTMPFVEQFVRHPQKLWLRKAIFQVHLWTGIAMGLYVVAISISGSALFFRGIVDGAAGRKVVAGSGPLFTRDQLADAATRAYPGYTVNDISLGRQPGREVEIKLRRGDNRKFRIFDPYTGRDLGEAVPYSVRIISWMLEFHVSLMAGPKGRMINGVAAILTTLLAITGLVIWWPGIKNWRRSLTINSKANWKRINWDLHSALGFWSFAFFFMWSFTGVYLVFPSPFDAAINHFAPLDYYRLLSEEPAPSTPANAAVSTVAFIPVADPVPTTNPVQNTNPVPNKGKRPRPKIHYSAGDQVIRVFFGAHFGNFAGVKTRVLWAVLGLAPPLLFFTGALMWWNRVLSKEGRRLTETSPRVPETSLAAGAGETGAV